LVGCSTKGRDYADKIFKVSRKAEIWSFLMFLAAWSTRLVAGIKPPTVKSLLSKL